MNSNPPFEVGSAVIDVDAEDPEPLYVLVPDCGRADEVHIDAIDQTVAAVNPEYPPDDIVVRCIHESWLTHHAEERWQQWPRDQFASKLHAYAAAWSLSPKTYDYPASRLSEAVEAAQSTQEVDDSDGQTSMDDWLG